MDPKVNEFLSTQPVGVISVPQGDGAPYAATIHYAHEEGPLRLYMQTHQSTHKVQSLLDGSVRKAAFVVGFSKEEWKTVQMTGDIKIVTDPTKLEEIYKVYDAKHPEMAQRRDEQTVILEFNPTWWRYSDFKSQPPTFIES